jgi:hypothetical protein
MINRHFTQWIWLVGGEETDWLEIKTSNIPALYQYLRMPPEEKDEYRFLEIGYQKRFQREDNSTCAHTTYVIPL